jgi:putative transcriptional regulator
MKRPRRTPPLAGSSYLDGQLLIAMPVMTDKRFARSVIYMCAHSKDGAMGLIINQRAANIDFPDLLERLGLTAVETGAGAEGKKTRTVHVGGPVESGRGFVLHSADYQVHDQTLQIDSSVCLTATIDILKAIAGGAGPDRSILALGYAGWSAGQLESEIAANGWLNCPADPDLVFSSDLERKYDRALAKLGVDLSHLVSDIGHA